MRRHLTHLGVAHNLVRHITSVSAQRLVDEVKQATSNYGPSCRPPARPPGTFYVLDASLDVKYEDPPPQVFVQLPDISVDLIQIGSVNETEKVAQPSVPQKVRKTSVLNCYGLAGAAKKHTTHAPGHKIHTSHLSLDPARAPSSMLRTRVD